MHAWGAKKHDRRGQQEHRRDDVVSDWVGAATNRGFGTARARGAICPSRHARSFEATYLRGLINTAEPSTYVHGENCVRGVGAPQLLAQQRAAGCGMRSEQLMKGIEPENVGSCCGRSAGCREWAYCLSAVRPWHVSGWWLAARALACSSAARASAEVGREGLARGRGRQGGGLKRTGAVAAPDSAA